MSDEDRRLTERDAGRVHQNGDQIESRMVDFPEVRGICRTCKHSHILRRQYSEVPTVFCQTLSYEQPKQVPLDVTECSAYDKKGTPSLRSMMEVAIILDTREQGGQYL